MSAQADAVDVMLPDGRSVSLDTEPHLKRRLQPALSDWAGAPDRRGENALFSSPAHCPTSMSWTSPANPSESALQQQCSDGVFKRLVDYDPATRQRCACIKVASSSSPAHVRIIDAAILDPFLYYTLTLVVSKGAKREQLRGFVAAGGGEFRIHNTNRQLVCSTRLTDANSTPGDLECFGGLSRAVGTYQLIHDIDSWGGSFGIGRYKVADGTQLDFAANLTDQELARRHPAFPETGAVAAADPLQVCEQRIHYNVVSDSTAAPPSVQAFLGIWKGDWGRLCSILVIRALNADGSVNVLYVWGRNESRPTGGFARYRATINGDTLAFGSQGGAKFSFKRSGNSLDATRRTSQRLDHARFNR